MWRLASEVMALGSHCMLRNLDLSHCSLPQGLPCSVHHSFAVEDLLITVTTSQMHLDGFRTFGLQQNSYRG